MAGGYVTRASAALAHCRPSAGAHRRVCRLHVLGEPSRRHCAAGAPTPPVRRAGGMPCGWGVAQGSSSGACGRAFGAAPPSHSLFARGTARAARAAAAAGAAAGVLLLGLLLPGVLGLGLALRVLGGRLVPACRRGGRGLHRLEALLEALVPAAGTARGPVVGRSRSLRPHGAAIEHKTPQEEAGRHRPMSASSCRDKGSTYAHADECSQRQGRTKPSATESARHIPRHADTRASGKRTHASGFPTTPLKQWLVSFLGEPPARRAHLSDSGARPNLVSWPPGVFQAGVAGAAGGRGGKKAKERKQQVANRIQRWSGQSWPPSGAICCASLESLSPTDVGRARPTMTTSELSELNRTNRHRPPAPRTLAVKNALPLQSSHASCVRSH